MPTHRNPSIVKDARTILNTQAEALSDEVLPNIVPVLIIAPYANIVRNNGATSSGTITIFTTPSDRDFYLTGYNITMAKDATSDLNVFELSATVGGSARSFTALALVSLTAQTFSVAQELAPPVKIDRNTGINLLGAFTVGACSRQGCIYGFTRDVAVPYEA